MKIIGNNRAVHICRICDVNIIAVPNLAHIRNIWSVNSVHCSVWQSAYTSHLIQQSDLEMHILKCTSNPNSVQGYKYRYTVTPYT